MEGKTLSDEELEELKKRRMLELQQQQGEKERQLQAQQELEAQKQAILRQILTPEARERLNRIKIVKPELADAVEMQLIQLAQAGRLGNVLTDEQLKTILRRLTDKQRDIKITRK
ncbi:MAG: DNA-binding protein [Candidatus Sifarchaeia archaeon]